jgi:flagellar M-ring protein FliF
MGRVVESAILALVALAAILLLGRPVVGRLAIAFAPVPALAGVAGALPGAAQAGVVTGDQDKTGIGAAPPDSPALPGGAEAQGPTAEQMVHVARVEGQIRASALHALAATVDQNPEQSAAVLRRWLTPEEKA